MTDPFNPYRDEDQIRRPHGSRSVSEDLAESLETPVTPPDIQMRSRIQVRSRIYASPLRNCDDAPPEMFESVIRLAPESAARDIRDSFARSKEAARYVPPRPTDVPSDARPQEYLHPNEREPSVFARLLGGLRLKKKAPRDDPGA